MTVWGELVGMVKVCEAKKKQTNYVSEEPLSWRRYTAPSGLTAIQWVTDFSDRYQAMRGPGQ